MKRSEAESCLNYRTIEPMEFIDGDCFYGRVNHGDGIFRDAVIKVHGVNTHKMNESIPEKKMAAEDAKYYAKKLLQAQGKEVIALVMNPSPARREDRVVAEIYLFNDESGAPWKDENGQKIDSRTMGEVLIEKKLGESNK